MTTSQASKLSALKINWIIMSDNFKLFIFLDGDVQVLIILSTIEHLKLHRVELSHKQLFLMRQGNPPLFLLFMFFTVVMAYWYKQTAQSFTGL